MARDDRSQTGAKEGIASDVDGGRGAAKGGESYRSNVGLESVAELDGQGEGGEPSASARSGSDGLEEGVGVGEPGADLSDRQRLDTGDRDERIDTREEASTPEEESTAGNRRAGAAVNADQAKPSRAGSPPSADADATGARSTGARGGGGGGRTRPSNEGASATSGRSGSHRAAKEAGQRQMNATIRGAGSSGEQRGATTGPRKATRTAASETRGTAKSGIRRGSSKSRSARRAGLH